MPEPTVPPWLGDPDTRGIGPFLDHTLLHPEATRDQVLRLCDEAVALGVRAVCVNGGWVALCAERLRESGVLVAAVVGFPLGAMATAAKAEEARIARAAGAAELDVVLARGALKGGDRAYVVRDIETVVDAAAGAPVKVILETAALRLDEIEAACRAAREGGAAFVKTSTGFDPAGGATVEAVALMRATVGLALGVKASGGIRTGAAALAMLTAGASRIGTSSAAAMADWIGPAAPTLAQLFRAEKAYEPDPFSPSGYE